MRVLDLFSGIGGFSLGLERAGMTTVAFCEYEPFCQKVLAKHWPNVPCYPDVRTLTKEQLDADGITDIDVICGGFPCQPFSSAAAGKNPEDTLSAEYLRIVGEVRPGICIAENVSKKAFSSGFIKSLQSFGYTRILPKHISGDAIGADHERSRWWLCAYTHDKGELSSAIDAEVARMSEIRQSIWGPENYARAVRISDGLSDRTHRLKALGNAVFPGIPEAIGRAIMMTK